MAFRLCLIVCLVAAPASRTSADPAGTGAGASAVSAQGGAQLVRETAQTEKPASTPWLAIAELPIAHDHAHISNTGAPTRQPASPFNLDAPPLAPRPPPA